MNININFNTIFFSFLLSAFIFSIIFITTTNNSFDLFNKIYGHGLSRDESLPFDISGKQIAIEGIMEPPFLNEGDQNRPSKLGLMRKKVMKL